MIANTPPHAQPDDSLLLQLQHHVRHQTIRKVRQQLPEAGVLVALTDDTCNPEIILTRRGSLLSSHAGEVAFPGGKRDPEDDSIMATALRESHEEIDLHPEKVDVIGPLNEVISKHGYRVRPFLGIIPTDVRLSPNPDELESLFRVPLHFLLDHGQMQQERLVYKKGTIHMPRYDYQGYVIWGLTAYVLVEMLNQGLNAGLPLQSRPEIT